ncbi:MAG: DUF4136 domain-containing protein [Epsilonproteobacteria bacterium]|nr:MAG: DUF4136 domain-containing protein [Campylobacterota bacterium]
MIKLILFTLTLILFTGCSTIKVETDYDPEYSFSNANTYAIVYKKKEYEDTLTADRIMEGIRTELTSKGYTEVKRSDADLFIVFHTDVHNKTRIVQDYQYIGISPYRYGYGYGYGGMMAVPMTRAYNYDEGKLMMDVLNSRDSKIVWRGIATDSLKNFKTPQERTKYINKVMRSIFETLPANASKP